MRLSLLLAAPAIALSLASCSEAQDAADAVDAVRDTAGKVADCAGLAKDVAAAGFDRVPTQAEAEAAKAKLDARVDGIADTTLREAAGSLSERVGELVEALRSTDRTQVAEKADAVRKAAGDAARACDVPVSQFVR